MTEFLDSIGYGQWILHALVVLRFSAWFRCSSGRSRRPSGRPSSSPSWSSCSLGLWWALDPSRGTQLVSNAPWIPHWGIAYRVGIDGISLVMVLLTTLLMPISVLASWQYITKQERGFYTLMLTLLTGLVGVFIALDLFVFYVFFEVRR